MVTTKPTTFIVSLALIFFADSRICQSSYIFGDSQQRRVTVVGKQVVMGYGSTVWHGKRGGPFFAFIGGKKMYLTTNKDGEVFVTEKKEDALRLDFAETNNDTSKSGYAVPEAASSISIRRIDSGPRNLIVMTKEKVTNAQGKPVKNVNPIRLVAPQESNTPDKERPGTIFIIRGMDSRYTVKDSD